MFTLCLVSLLIGSTGFAGSVAVTVVTGLISLAWFLFHCVTRGTEGRADDRNPWIQGFWIFVHWVGALVSVLLYVQWAVEGTLTNLSLREIWGEVDMDPTVKITYSVSAFVLAFAIDTINFVRAWREREEYEEHYRSRIRIQVRW